MLRRNRYEVIIIIVLLHKIIMCKILCRKVRGYWEDRSEIFMSEAIKNLIEMYVSDIRNIYGNHLRQVILYGSYARGDFNSDSDVDIMILLDMPDTDIKKYRHELSDMTFDFNMDYDVDIKPIAKSEEHYRKWISSYPFYKNVDQEGVTLYSAA